MSLPSWLSCLRPASSRAPAERQRGRRRGAVHLRVEPLEERNCPSGGYLLVADFGGDTVLRYDGTTGAFVDTFVPKQSGGMNQPYGVLFGPDGNGDGRQDLYVSTGEFGGPGQLKAVLRYDGVTGRFMDEFTMGGDLKGPTGIIFGPDGNLYVATLTGGAGGRVARYDALTGAFLGDFVPPGSGGLRAPSGMVFGPAGKNPTKLDLYVSSRATHSILRYDGATGAFLEEFVTSGSGGLDTPQGLTFGPDGNLYVASSAILTNNARGVLRFQGPAGATPGAFLDAFVPADSGELKTPFGVIFGPDGNRDGHLDLYVTNSEFNGNSSNGKNATVKRYDGVTGALIDTFVAAGSGGLDDAQFLTFTETDPVSLAYTGGRRTAAAAAPDPVNETLSADQLQALLAESLACWQNARVDISSLSTLAIRIADLPDATLGQAVGQTIWPGPNAAGWTPWDDGAFTTPGDQGEQDRIDLLGVPRHETGHALGFGHDDGTLSATLPAGERLAPGARPIAALDGYFGAWQEWDWAALAIALGTGPARQP